MAEAISALGVAGVALLYARGVTELWSVAGGDRLVRRWQATAFAVGLVALLAALASPLEAAADRNLAWHMVQHVTLLCVAAPLLAVGAPLTAMLYALPAAQRARVQPGWRRLVRSQSDRRWLVWTAGSLVLATFTLGVWHVPTLYDAAVRNDWVHALEHASFVATAMLFWWMVLAAGRRSRRGVGVVVVFLATLPATALGVLMTLAVTSWYSPYGRGAAAVRDQQVAGAVMWAFGGFALVAAGAALFASWLVDLDRADERARARTVAEPW
ncbi:MAG TPA: cytochrome c oxidase assembly protein [Acidimicrobiia bacterium]